MIKGHGDDAYQYKNTIKYNFSSNIYKNIDLSDLKTYLCKKINCINSYPEPEATKLENIIAEKSNILPDNVLVTNGAIEAIYLISQAYFKATSFIPVTTFSEYKDASTINKHKIVHFSSLKELQNNNLSNNIKPSNYKLVWLCNPNNPDGKYYNLKELNSLIIKYPEIIFILDQSYEFFLNKKVFTPPEGCAFPNVIILHSMTKKFAIPGLRLGYITANKDLIQQVKEYKIPWSVNALAIEAGIFVLNYYSINSKNIEELLKEREWLSQEINKIQLFETLTTYTHYFLVHIKNNLQRLDSKRLKDILAKEYDILIRDASNFGGLDNFYFRIATQEHKQNIALIKALKEINIKYLIKI